MLEYYETSTSQITDYSHTRTILLIYAAIALPCSEDERIISAAVEAMGDGRRVHIFDCRSRGIALANQTLRGGGREDAHLSHIKEYGIAAYRLLNIASASAQRAYYDELCTLVRPLTTRTLRNIRLMASISATAWFRQISLIISAANEVQSSNRMHARNRLAYSLQMDLQSLFIHAASDTAVRI